MMKFKYYDYVDYYIFVLHYKNIISCTVLVKYYRLQVVYLKTTSSREDLRRLVDSRDRTTERPNLPN